MALRSKPSDPASLSPTLPHSESSCGYLNIHQRGFLVKLRCPLPHHIHDASSGASSSSATPCVRAHTLMPSLRPNKPPRRGAWPPEEWPWCRVNWTKIRESVLQADGRTDHASGNPTKQPHDANLENHQHHHQQDPNNSSISRLVASVTPASSITSTPIHRSSSDSRQESATALHCPPCSVS